MNQMIFDFVTGVAGKLGYSMEQAWPMLVQYTWAKGISAMVGGSAFFIAGIWLIPIGLFNKCVRDGDMHFCTIMMGIVGIVVGLGIITAFIPNVLAPEGSAIIDLIQTLKPSR